MKIKTKKNSRKNILIISIAVAVLFAGGAFVYLKTQHSDNPQQDERSSKPSSKSVKNKKINEDANEFKESNQTRPETTESSPTSEPSKAMTPGNEEDVSEKPPVRPEIANISRSGSTLEVVSIFRSTANGTCKLILSKSGKSDIVRESPITIGPSYYLCGFTVDGIDGSGWDATITHLYEGKESESVKQRIQ